MNLGVINVDYLDHMGNDASAVNAARVSFGKFKSTLDDKDIKLLNYLAKNSHFSPFEHCTLSVRISCPLYIRSQIHRHRTFSYNEISRRYTEENLSFYLPDQLRKQHKSSKQCSSEDFPIAENAILKDKIERSMEACLRLYENLIQDGVARELARGVLPQNLMTEFIMTGNLRNWTGFLKLRLDEHAQYEVRTIAKKIQDILKVKFPESAKALFKHL